LFGDYFYPTNQSYHQYPVGKKSVFRHFAPEAFFLVLNSTYMQSTNNNNNNRRQIKEKKKRKPLGPG